MNIKDADKLATPGPLVIRRGLTDDGYQETYIYGYLKGTTTQERLFAEAFGETEEEANANTFLISHARQIPALVEALEGLLLELTLCGYHKDEIFGSLTVPINKARAALALVNSNE